MKNYNQMSKKNYDKPEPVEQIETPIETEAVDQPSVPEPVEGVVDCAKLNVRSDATLDSDPVGIIKRGVKVFVYEDESTEEFYKVCTATSLEGYCMREYIKVL